MAEPQFPPPLDICPLPYKCWLNAEPFKGGSRAAGRQEHQVEDSAERRCEWERCLHRCPLFSCSDPFHLEVLRPPCAPMTARTKPKKKNWCYESEGQLMPFCDFCPRAPYLCPSPPPPKPTCATAVLRDKPLFTWTDGYSTPNYGDAPFPYLARHLRPPRIDPPTPLEVPPPCQTSAKEPRLERCSEMLGGPGERTRRWRLEELLYNPKRFFDKRAGGFCESPWCRPVPCGGVLARPPCCTPCACPRPPLSY